MTNWIKRKPTKLVRVGNVKVGDSNPISVQSMTNTNTCDVNGTINQINSLVAAGADIVRVSVPDEDSDGSARASPESYSSDDRKPEAVPESERSADCRRADH